MPLLRKLLLPALNNYSTVDKKIYSWIRAIKACPEEGVGDIETIFNTTISQYTYTVLRDPLRFFGFLISGCLRPL